jgi:hypothetical protein
MLQEFQRGIRIEGEQYRIKSYVLLSPFKARMILTEGKNREIRNFFIFKRSGETDSPDTYRIRRLGNSSPANGDIFPERSSRSDPLIQ